MNKQKLGETHEEEAQKKPHGANINWVFSNSHTHSPNSFNSRITYRTIFAKLPSEFGCCVTDTLAARAFAVVVTHNLKVLGGDKNV